MRPLKSLIDLNSTSLLTNYQQMQDLCNELRTKLDLSLSEGSDKYIERNKKRGKLLARERVELLLDEDAPFLELMPLAGIDQEIMTLGASIVAGIGLVSGVECLISANVQTIKGGAINAMSVKKASRLDEVAFENNLPIIYLTESGGADLPQQAEIFNYGGKAFREITRRSKLGIPSICGVFGSSTAGGAYIPGMSDYVVMVKNQAKTYLAGPPLVKMAINEIIDDETLGGASMHSKESGLSDYLAEDEVDCIRIIREIVANLNLNKETIFEKIEEIKDPIYDKEELLKVVSADVRVPFDSKEVIMRIVDGSVFSEFKPLYGPTLICGYAKIFGQTVGILANNGVLFSDSANKGAHFIQLCNKRSIPLIFLQNITGFMVGKDAEEGGIIKNGAKLINAVANSTVPAITIIMGGSYGAGNYGMCGRAYAPRFLFSYPNAKIAVMGSDQLAGVMEIIQEEKAKKDKSMLAKKIFDKAKGKVIKEALKKKIDEESSAYYGTSRLWDDGVIDPRDTRTILGICLSSIYNNEIKGADSFGVFRM